MHDFLALAKTTPENENVLEEAFFYYNRAQRRAWLTGPRHNDNYDQLWSLLLSAEHSLGDEHFYNGPLINLYVGKNSSGSHIAGVDIVIGDKAHGGQGRYFDVFEHRNTSGSYIKAFGLDATTSYLHRDYLYFRSPGGTTTRGWIYAQNNTIALSKSANHFIVIDEANDQIRFVIDGQVRFWIDNSGAHSVSSSSASSMQTMAATSDESNEPPEAVGGGEVIEATDIEKPVVNNVVHKGEIKIEQPKLQTRRSRD